MIKPIIHDQNFLSQKAKLATKNDLSIAIDLVDTLKANADRGVGLAANMIGSDKRIIVVAIGIMSVPMLNPVILKKKDSYQTMEGCLSLTGERPTKRYREIEVSYLDTQFNQHTQKFTDWIAQIIQHEVDHCEGIMI